MTPYDAYPENVLSLAWPCPGVPLGTTPLGCLYDLRAETMGTDSVLLYWEYDPLFQGQKDTVFFCTYVNGEFYAKTRQLSQVVGGLRVGSKYDVQILVLPPDIAESANWLGSQGDRFLLQWEPGLGDVKEYRLYTNDGTGAVSYSSPHKTIKTITPDHVEIELPQSGTGTGFLETDGEWILNDLGADITIEIVQSGDLEEALWRWSLDEIEQATNLTVSDEWAETVSGIYARFSGSGFVAGDSWTVQVRCQSQYETDSLSSGSWKFVPRPVDAAGNEADTDLPEINLTVASVPDPLAGVDLEWSGGVATLSWTENEDVEVNVYSNRGSASNPVPDFFAAAYTASGGDGSIEIGSLAPGSWVFCVRAWNKWGEEENLDLLELTIDASNEEAVIPTEPLAFSAQSRPDGTIRVHYAVASDAESIRIYSNGKSGAVNYDEIVDTKTLSGSGVRTGYLDVTFEQLGNGEGSYDLAVRCVSTSGHEDSGTDYVSAVADATAPVAPQWGKARAI